MANMLALLLLLAAPEQAPPVKCPTQAPPVKVSKRLTLLERYHLLKKQQEEETRRRAMLLQPPTILFQQPPVNWAPPLSQFNGLQGCPSGG